MEDSITISGGLSTIDKVANEADEIYRKLLNAKIDPRNTFIDYYFLRKLY